MNKQESPLSEVPEVPASINAESEKQRRERSHELLLQYYAKSALQGAIEQGDPAVLAYIRAMAEVEGAYDIYTSRLAQLMREETNEDTLLARIEADPQLLQQKTRIEGLRERERLSAAFQSWATQGKLSVTEATAYKSLATRSAALSQVLRFTGDNIHRAAITAWARAAEWQTGENYFRGLEQEYKNLKITVSLPNGDQAASLWEFLQKSGAATVKAHYALWARYYEQVPDGLSVEYVVVNVSDFCRDLGYAKATNGGYKPEAKRRAMQLLEALTSTQMAATYQVPGQKKGHAKMRRLKGTIWARGLEAEERDTYEDLLGHSRAGAPELWTPCSFSFAPGPWHADKDWRRHNRFVGKIGAGIMRLRVDRDEWAILIGGYLGTLARTGKYRARRLKISTILENTGLDKAIGHRHAQFREKLYRALDRLQEEGIIAGYKTDGFDDSDVDPDDLAALAEYGETDPYPPGDWRGYIVEFQFDFAADMHRLEAREKKAIAAKRKPRGKRKEIPTHAV
jgi:hypothetical protein